MRFVKKLEDTPYSLGDPLRLSCTFTGSQRVHVSWTKDDKPIWASYKYNVKTTDSSCVLEVLNSDREEAAGLYSCQISNAQGSDVCDAFVVRKIKKKGIASSTLHSKTFFLTNTVPQSKKSTQCILLQTIDCLWNG